MDRLLSQQEQAFLVQLLAIPGCDFEEATMAALALADDRYRSRTDIEQIAIASIVKKFNSYGSNRHSNQN